MKNLILYSVLIILSVTTINAQSVEWYFNKMPVEMLPLLPVNSRKDLVDFYKNERTAVMPTSLGGEMILKEMSDDYLLLQTSQASGIQIKILNLNETKRILALVTTVDVQYKNSTIQFFDADWKPLSDITLPPVSVSDFFDYEKGGKEMTERFEKFCIRNFVEMKFEPKSNILTLKSSVRQDFGEELPKEFLPFIKENISLKWENGLFLR
jgi:hypothetical protein